MAIEIFKLFGSIMVNNDKANESISATDKKAQGLGSRFLKGIGTAAKWGAGIATAAGAGAIALGGIALKASDAASEIERLSQTTGMTTDEFQRWDGVMKKYGYSMEQASGDLAALGEKAMDAAEGVGEGAELFGKLGVAVTDSSGQLRSQQDIFNDTITALQGMENVTERNAIASALLSTTGEELVPILNMTNEELEKMKGQSSIIDEQKIKQAREFKNSWENIKGAFSGIVTQIGISVMPMFQGLFDWINSNMPIIQSVLSGVFGEIELLVSTFVGVFTSYINGVGLSWNTIWAEIQTYFQYTWQMLLTLWETLGKPIFDFIIMMVDNVRNMFIQYWPLICEIFSTFVNDMCMIWENNLKPMFQAIGDFISNVLAPVFNWLFNNIISPVFGSILNTISNIWTNGIKPIFTGIIDFITGVFSGNWSKAWDGIISAFGGIFSGLGALVKAPINAVISIVNGMIDKINGLAIEIPDWVPGLGGNTFGLNIPDIPMLYKGTDYFKGGMALVGERGPELVTMPRGSKVNTAEETESILNRGGTFILQTVLDGSVIAETIAPFSDIVGGNRLNLSKRGVLV